MSHSSSKLPNFVLARYGAKGLLDRTFSGDGKQRTNFGADEASTRGVVIQLDGKIVAAGYASPGTRFALARYLPSGALDRTFSRDGKQTTSFGLVSYGFDVARQANGRIVVAGQATLGTGPYDFVLVRYLAS